MSQPAILPRLPDIPPSDPSSSPSTSTANDERRPSQLESYGIHCQEPTCNLGDFLPFKCDYCRLNYCSYHRLPFSHSCSVYDEGKLDNRVSLCQFCQEPLRIDHLLNKNNNGRSSGNSNGREIDINTIMEWHISNNQCKVLKDIDKDGLFRDNNNKSKGSNQAISSSSTSSATNNGKIKKEKICTYGKCKNIMWVEIQCSTCDEKFCPTHKDKKSHKCGEDDAKKKVFGSSSSSSSSGYNNNSSSSKSLDRSNSSTTKFATRSKQQNNDIRSSTSPNLNSSSSSSSSAPFMRSKLSSTSTNTNTSTGTSFNKRLSESIPQNPFSKLSLSTSINNNNKNVVNSSNNNNDNNSADDGDLASTSPKTTTTASTSTTTTNNVIQILKGKTTSNINEMSSNRRAAREREQAALALKKRAEKGLLTEDQKMRYATLQALEANKSLKKKDNKDKDCCVQ